jgi:biopolymer transport protein TolR
MGTLTGRGSKPTAHQPMSEINVTPFVDVMLVLLVIFMVTAPLMVSGIAVELPRSTAGPLAADEKALSVTLTGQGIIFVNDEIVAISDLPGVLVLAASKSSDPAKRIVLLRADQSLDYGLVVSVLGNVTAAGFQHISLVSVGAPETDAPS